MLAAGKVAEHPNGVGAVLRLAEDLARTAGRFRQDDHRVRRDEDFVVGKGAVESVRLAFRHAARDLVIRHLRTEGFLEVILRINLEINI